MLLLHKGLEEAAQPLGREGLVTSKESSENLQAFLLQALLLLPDLFPLILPGKAEARNVDPLLQAGETQD